MTNSQLQLQQFERNHYFYGKLLTVRDFQLEQSYMNEKRNLLNRFVHGTGVIGGLHLAPIDGTGIRLTPGTALDANGREIVVAANVDIADISKLAGYPPVYGGGVLYATLSYDETAREPVPAVANAIPGQDGIETNKIRETFRFALTTEPPAASANLDAVYRKTVTIFENDQIIVNRSVPRVVNPGDIIEVVLSVTTKLAPTGTLQVDIVESLPSLFTQLSSWKDNKIPFVLTGLPMNTTRSQRYYARAGELPAGGTIGGNVFINSVLFNSQHESELAVVADRSVIRLLAEQYFDKQLSNGGASEGTVVLAALTISNKGLITAIDESVRPFVYNNELLFQLLLSEKQRPPVLPTHAATHRSGGPDELNVNNLSGTLADPQKVAVQDEGTALTVRTKINFVGAGVTASDDSVNNRTNVTIAGMTSHAASHQDGGADKINVNNLSGTLADPQKVTVQEEGVALTPRTKINFVGPGVTATDDPTNSRINVSISGASLSHAATHQDGGTDEINVNNLSGTLADPQKVLVQDEGTALTARPKINFTGAGVIATDDPTNNRINVTIAGGGSSGGSGAIISSGSVTFQDVAPGQILTSPAISHQLLSNNVGIVLGVAQSFLSGGIIESAELVQSSDSIDKLATVEKLDAAESFSASLSTGGGGTTPPIIVQPDPGPVPPSFPNLYPLMQMGNVAELEPESPLVVASYRTNSSSSFSITLQDRRVFTGLNESVNWIVTWWAFAGTVQTGGIIVQGGGTGSGGVDTSLVGGVSSARLTDLKVSEETVADNKLADEIKLTEPAPETIKRVRKPVVKDTTQPAPGDPPAES
ncbi:hypothetical protein PaecuDRAFT_1764 [Paenibacillus curdlanolyticus YK9]|uniref:Uncharacterized protein n=1 Tax=Paenibacillus curdlanolyticus YK9 TaxID=717606 RepID=E0I813_9BACL|nr:hypothetical protein [Paenibacillus curdlanolyticus]EFM11318.1 hypothetical protein PaecuDRAFT_1764 [Paenibacillus curdlanolyticus YK9]